ncbi:MAG: DNA polymerase III subunit epsilon [Kiloniellales bacterium]
MREVVVDTETTGLDPSEGHRIVELACLELANHLPTGRIFHHYIDPQRDIPTEAYDVHGISAEFLAGKPPFAEIAKGFIAFIGEDRLVMHNAEFDLKFLNAELEALGRPRIPLSRTVDTLAMARRKFPGAQASLDALCRRFEIDNSARTTHGALLDAELLAAVYIELCGGRQPGFELGHGGPMLSTEAAPPRSARPPRPHGPTAEEATLHERLVKQLKDPVWER